MRYILDRGELKQIRARLRAARREGGAVPAQHYVSDLSRVLRELEEQRRTNRELWDHMRRVFVREVE